MPQLCNRCFRTTDEDFDTCPSKDSYLPCPPPVDVTDDKVVIVKCGACPKVRAIPIGNIMQRKRLTELGPCVSDQCQAVVILPTVARPHLPPPIADADIADLLAPPPSLPPVTGKKRGKGK